MTKTSVKFQNNRNKTVGGVAHKRYILHYYMYLARRNDTSGRTGIRKDDKPKLILLRFFFFFFFFFFFCFFLFFFVFEKAGDKNRYIPVLLYKSGV